MPLTRPLSRYGLPLLLVSAVHVAALAGLWRSAPARPAAPPMTEVMLLSLSPQPTPATPSPPQAVPKPVARPEPKTVSKPEPTPVLPTPPAPFTPPSLPVAAPSPAAPATAPSNSEAVITPPRLDASYRGNIAPPYPSLSKRLGEAGTVLLHILVKEDGMVGEVRLNKSSGFSRLDQAAIETVKRWKLIPARRGSEPFAAWYNLPINFNLEN